jgi:hypothetical protein
LDDKLPNLNVSLPFGQLSSTNFKEKISGFDSFIDSSDGSQSLSQVAGRVKGAGFEAEHA